MHRPPKSVRGLWSDPEWEAAKAACRSLNHADAVRECAELSELYRRMWQPGASGIVDLHNIIQAVQAKKVPFVLTGAHGISGWTGRPRATYAADLLVKAGRNHARAVKALRIPYPQLDVRESAGVTGFFPLGEKTSLINVTSPHRADHEETLRTAIWVTGDGQRYRVPTLEAALANKYGAMCTPSRDLGTRLLDTVDFAFMVKHSADEGRQPIDLELLVDLGEKVWPGGGGAEILRLVEELRAGRFPDVNALVARRL